MRNRFVSHYFKRDLRKKLQRLNQGDRSIEEYYQELQINMLRCDIIEDEEAAMACFYGGLRREIKDIVVYKEYDSVPRLFQLECLAEKRIAGMTTEAKEQFWKHDHFKMIIGTSQNSPHVQLHGLLPVSQVGRLQQYLRHCHTLLRLANL